MRRYSKLRNIGHIGLSSGVCVKDREGVRRYSS